MRDAYRDDLAAAELRVRDLEREHAALAAHNAKLEALVAPAPAVRPAQRGATTGVLAFIALVAASFIALAWLVGGGR